VENETDEGEKVRLIHHDKDVVIFDPDRLYPSSQRENYFKPKGLWVSDEDDFGWSHWCAAEEFRPDSLKYEHLVELYPYHNVLIIRDVEDLDKFHEAFGKDILGPDRPWDSKPRKDWLDWQEVYQLWQGIIVTPYLWDRRMDYMWYYGWDCASGCIWDLRAIRSFQPLFKQLTWKEVPSTKTRPQ
jgi:hypothetical protein